MMFQEHEIIDIDPRSVGVLVAVNSANSMYQYDGQATMRIERVGCQDEPCDTPLEYDAIRIDWPDMEFRWDERILDLRAGRYTGIVTIGCEEVACALDFRIGRKLCLTAQELNLREDAECGALDTEFLQNPNCEPCNPDERQNGTGLQPSNYDVSFQIGPMTPCGTGRVAMVIKPRCSDQELTPCSSPLITQEQSSRDC